MPSFIIEYNNATEQWTLAVANTPDIFIVPGTGEAAESAVRAFAQGMSIGQEEALQAAVEHLPGLGNNVEEWLQETDTIMYLDEEIYTAEEWDLWESITDAGDALLEALMG